MDNLVWNERTKLLAGAIDRLSTACFTLGIIGGFALHMFAQIVLGKLQQ